MRRIQLSSMRHLGLLALLIVPLLAGCRAEEQGRITMYKPGEYMGKKHVELSQDQVRGLRLRASAQSGSTKPSGGGSSISVDEIDAGALGQRTSNQGGT